ncbi:MAG: hypothetical protein NVS1B14_07690 [Vulcanimicrobiaceae bacterium]
MSDIFACIERSDEDAVRALLESDPACAYAVSSHGISALLFAKYHRLDRVVELIRAQGIELSVFEAAAVGDLRSLERMLELDRHEALALSADGFTAAHLAAYFCQSDALALLLKAGADANAVAHNHSKVTPIHSAVAGGDAECVRLLLDAGADPNVQQAGGFTPLHEAAERNKRAIYDALVAAGATRAP